MKKVISILLMVAVTVILPCMAEDSLAGGWKSYDDFEDFPLGLVVYDPSTFVIDENWRMNSRCIDEDIATISVEDFNGSQQAKFTYNQTSPGRSCNLLMNNCPERIVGIKADVTVTACADNQDGRGRVGWHRGMTPGDNYYTWEDIQVRPMYENVAASRYLLDPEDGFSYTEDTFFTQFNNPVNIIGETFTVSGIFDKPGKMIVTIEGQGTITYELEEKDNGPMELYKGIGMYVRDVAGQTTDGELEVYFDNVYVKTKGGCDRKAPKVKKTLPNKKLPLDNCDINIIFSEPMDFWSESIDSPPEWPIGDTSWSDDLKTFTISRDNCGTPLPADTSLEFVVNPGGTGFKDLAGYEANEKTINFVTEN